MLVFPPQKTLESKALLQNPVGAQVVRNFRNFYGNSSFITVLTKAYHWTLS